MRNLDTNTDTPTLDIPKPLRQAGLVGPGELITTGNSFVMFLVVAGLLKKIDRDVVGEYLHGIADAVEDEDNPDREMLLQLATEQMLDELNEYLPKTHYLGMHPYLPGCLGLWPNEIVC